MKGLLRKILLEVRIPVLLFSVGLALIMFLLTSLLPKVLVDVGGLMDRIPFIKPILSAFMGVDVSEGFTAEMMQAFLWVHPSVMAMLWAHELMYCSRVPAAEIDRGTIDFLLGLPASRWKIYMSETIGWLISGATMIGLGVSGHWAASSALQPDMRPGNYAILCVAANLFAVYLAVGAVAFLVSANSDRRGRTIGFMFALLLASYLLNFVAQFWQPAKTISFLSVMEYYRPATIIRTNEFPWLNVMLLMCVASVSWAAGAMILRKRSITTV